MRRAARRGAALRSRYGHGLIGNIRDLLWDVRHPVRFLKEQKLIDRVCITENKLDECDDLLRRTSGGKHMKESEVDAALKAPPPKRNKWDWDWGPFGV